MPRLHDSYQDDISFLRSHPIFAMLKMIAGISGSPAGAVLIRPQPWSAAETDIIVLMVSPFANCSGLLPLKESEGKSDTGQRTSLNLRIELPFLLVSSQVSISATFPAFSRPVTHPLCHCSMFLVNRNTLPPFYEGICAAYQRLVDVERRRGIWDNSWFILPYFVRRLQVFLTLHEAGQYA